MKVRFLTNIRDIHNYASVFTKGTECVLDDERAARLLALGYVESLEEKTEEVADTEEAEKNEETAKVEETKAEDEKTETETKVEETENETTVEETGEEKTDNEQSNDQLDLFGDNKEVDDEPKKRGRKPKND